MTNKMTKFNDLTLDEQAEIAMRIAALAIMDGVETYQDMMDEAEWLCSQFWNQYRSIDENPAMWNCYLACVCAASCVEQHWLAVNHERIGCRYDDRMKYHFEHIQAIIDEIEAAHQSATASETDTTDINEDDGVEDCLMGVRFKHYPESSTPIAMTIEESDSMRATGEYDADPMLVARSFADEWMRCECPEVDLPAAEVIEATIAGIEETVQMYEDEYDDLRHDCGEAWTPDEVAEYLYAQVDQMTSQWTDDDEQTLDNLHALWAYEMDDEDDHEDIVEEWTEWLVLAGELERIDTGDDISHAVWAWCPNHRAELPGSDQPIDSLDEARQIFDAYDPMGLWFSKRHEEAQAGEEPRIWRRFEVDLVCQTCTRDADGLISVRDDAVRLSKDFDVDGDKAAQALISSILSHI